MSWVVRPQDGEPTPASTPTVWLVRYTAASGQVITAHHDTREGARDALVDQLLASALQLWQIARTLPANHPAFAKTRKGYEDRGDRFIHHAARLMETTEDGYIIAGAGGRKWILCEVPSEVKA